MTFVKFNQAPAVKSFGGLVEDIFNNANKFLKDDYQTNDFYGAYPPVNITENKESYQVDLLVPGLNKEDFKISLENKILTISAEKVAEAKDENQKQLRREFSFRSFKRSFTLNEQVDAEKIQAKYENGVLKLQLAKKEKVQDAAKAIVVE
ncbi:Hsp20/alpha crystallin family protein [Chitinophaga rhizophila]|uniref:Hsp20/alpha crystallin family protein n=1 Tax=Chitinophaga rhizophila TaxID=2866212 RepID=A0ABS7GB05_9BACT|nr:Hsp20/alpha crystallin family protein [Chitinophaga rhizophila]MBW8684850.1 Hsp20/alpha crystallin family protein [Chitinophaga rhizophila]